jgi:GNAT superfamily N-acetyltransferase
VPSLPTGRAALDELTLLARRQRLADPFRGAVEAADLQWRSKSDQRDVPGATVVWHDAAGPVAAVFTTRSRLGVDLDVICLEPGLVEECRAAADDLLSRQHGVDAWTSFQHDDPDWTAWATGHGFTSTDDVVVTTWRDATPPPAAPLAPGYRLASRATTGGRPHHMAVRNGDHIAERLARCPLYRADLDLMVLTDDDDVAAYGLFWPDPVTGVGLVEPMRTEDAHQGLGLARAVLTEGMRRLVAAGSTRLKVSYFADNEPAERLYLGVGFVPVERSRILVRRAVG